MIGEYRAATPDDVQDLAERFDGVDLNDPVPAAQGRPVFELHAPAGVAP